MCFAPQRRALFPHLNYQKWRGADVFCTFLLPTVLGATTACTFSTSQRPKVARTCGNLSIFTACTFSTLNFEKWLGAEVFCTFLLVLAVPFSSLHIVGSLASKLPSTIYTTPSTQHHQHNLINTTSSTQHHLHKTSTQHHLHSRIYTTPSTPHLINATPSSWQMQHL